MKTRVDKRDLAFLRNQVDLLTLRVDDLSADNDKKYSKVLKRLRGLEDELMCRKQILNSREAAKYLGVSVKKIYRLVRSGLPYFRNDRKLFFERQSLKEWIQYKSN